MPRVAEQVPSIGDLDRGRCTSSDRASIFSRAVPRDEADPRPGLKPGGQRFGIAIGQQVNRPPTLEIDDDRAVARAFPQCPVVDADDRRRGGSGNGRSPDQPEQRVAAGWHAELVGQAAPRLATECHAYLRLCLGEPPCAPRPMREQHW